jgi:GT2 family glycosyltransferase
MDRLLEGSTCLRVPYTGPFNFAAMNNLGAGKATGTVLVFLNDDVEPLDSDWLGAMLAHACRREVGAVGAKLVYPSGAIQHAGIVIGIMEGAGHLHRNTFGSANWNWLPFTRNVCAVTGACLAMRKSVFEELGGFDESFPENYNDVDLCLRARQAGYEVIVEPAAVLRHSECQSRQAGVRLEERYTFERRWAAWLERGDPFYSPHLSRRLEDAGLELQDLAEPAAWR